jgi:hypothetical protein
MPIAIENLFSKAVHSDFLRHIASVAHRFATPGFNRADRVRRRPQIYNRDLIASLGQQFSGPATDPLRATGDGRNKSVPTQPRPIHVSIIAKRQCPLKPQASGVEVPRFAEWHCKKSQPLPDRLILRRPN